TATVVIGNTLATLHTQSGILANIHGSITVEDPPALLDLIVDDSGDPNPTTVTDTLSSDGVFGTVTGLAPVPIIYNTFDTRSVTLLGSAGGMNLNLSENVDLSQTQPSFPTDFA